MRRLQDTLAPAQGTGRQAEEWSVMRAYQSRVPHWATFPSLPLTSMCSAEPRENMRLLTHRKPHSAASLPARRRAWHPEACRGASGKHIWELPGFCSARHTMRASTCQLPDEASSGPLPTDPGQPPSGHPSTASPQIEARLFGPASGSVPLCGCLCPLYRPCNCPAAPRKCPASWL